MKTKNDTPLWLQPHHRFRLSLVRFLVHLLAWIGMAVLFYVGFSFFFDTPVEYRMKQSTRRLAQEYDALSARYDTLERAFSNVVERDRSVFKTLFEAEPYDLDGKYEENRWVAYEKLLGRSNKNLGEEFMRKITALERSGCVLAASQDNLSRKAEELGGGCNNVPAIQPVINKELTLMTASFGLRIHPFYKSLHPHGGVDYTTPEGTRVFATADGEVRDVVSRNSTSGLTVIIAHGNGYETSYGHLLKVNVRKGERVRRGDIIALTGNSGLSLAPHLHYEVRHNGLRVDPVHYFFMELTPGQYQKMIGIAQSGMQSFD